jgi:hypothetical protein
MTSNACKGQGRKSHKGPAIAQEMEYLIRGRREKYVKCFPNKNQLIVGVHARSILCA